ncbi:MAG: hypothetical protein ACRDIX_05715 [Actinomycetota bacterium]
MKIDEVFLLEDGRTVFVGLAETPSGRSGPMTCELFVNGQVVQVLRLEGEILADWSPDELRSVSTDWDVSVPFLDQALESRCRFLQGGAEEGW